MHAMSVAILMGSSSDASVMDDAVQTLRSFDVPVEVRVLSAHRTPDDTIAFARGAAAAGVQVIIAAAGGAAHLAGVVAATTPLPVIGVPVALANLGGLDSLLAMVQMPKGIPVATVAVNGARNAALLAVRIIALSDARLAAELDRFIADLADQVRDMDAEIVARYRAAGAAVHGGLTGDDGGLMRVRARHPRSGPRRRAHSTPPPRPRDDHAGRFADQSHRHGGPCGPGLRRRRRPPGRPTRQGRLSPGRISPRPQRGASPSTASARSTPKGSTASTGMSTPLAT